MAGFAAQAALRHKWGDLVDESETDVSESLKNAFGWIKQASSEVREAGKRAVVQIQTKNPNLIPANPLILKTLLKLSPSSSTNDLETSNGTNSSSIIVNDQNTMGSTDNSSVKKLTILHYNDVYNIDPNSLSEPVGGAARFCTAIKSFQSENPLVLFSGDAFNPSMLSTFTQGEQMVPVLNAVGTHCSVFGNHDFDHGLEILQKWVEKTNFPWLMSNVIDNETGRPLGGGKITHILNHNGLRIGLIGLVEKEWLDTLPTIDPNEVTYIDYVKAGNQLADDLRKEGCEVIIALTHMRTPNDIELAKKCQKLDLILGGHDHVYEVIKINHLNVIKSGTDFRQFSKISLEKIPTGNHDEDFESLQVDVEKIDVTSKFEEDAVLKVELSKYSAMIESKMTEILGNFSVELDARFSMIRTSETNLGNWICDVALSATGADIVIINSGTFRSDQIHPPGPFSMKDLVSIIPMQDPLIVLEMLGSELYKALENSVSAYPKLEGRFPQVAGISFTFDPAKPPGNRVEPNLVRIADEWLNFDQKYAVCVKSYMYGGCDGYNMFKKCKVLMDEDACPELGLALQNHFKAIDIRMGKNGRHTHHRQSLVTLSRRHSMVQMLENLELDGPTPIRLHHPTQVKTFDMPSLNNSAKLLRRASLEDLEQVSCQLAPRLQHRIIPIQNADHLHQLMLRKETMQKTTVIKEMDESSP